MLQTEDVIEADVPQSLKSLEYMSMVSHMRTIVFQKRKYSFSGVKSMEYMFSVEDL
jgi:hypothetical protein